MSNERTFGVSGQITVSEDQLSEMAAEEAVSTPVEVAGSDDNELAMVTAMQPTKGSETVRVPVGTTVAALLEELGWDHGSQYTFKLTTEGQQGAVKNFKDPHTTQIGAGVHYLVVQPKIRGG